MLSNLTLTKLHRLNITNNSTDGEFRNHYKDIPGKAQQYSQYQYCGVLDADK